MINGEILKSVRKRLGLTQQELAETLAVTVSTVYKWETKEDEFIPQKYWSTVKTLRATTKEEAQLRMILHELTMDLDEKNLKEIIKLVEQRIKVGKNKIMPKNERKTR